MFVLAFDFLYQREDNPKIWDLLNFTRALTVITLFFELCLNNINIRFDQYPANIAWTLMYLLFVWPAVFAGALVGWPYALLQTRNSHCFLNYAGLFAVNFGFYCLWVLAYRVKKGVFVFFNIGRIGSNFYDPEETNLSDHELHTLHEVVAQHDAGFGGSGTAGSASVRASSLPEGYGYGDEYGDTYAPTSAGYSVPSKSVESPYDSPYGYYDEAQGGLRAVWAVRVSWGYGHGRDGGYGEQLWGTNASTWHGEQF
ncbi:hypothetical protein B484DRAFT_192007 [Ochromonadaceae sp. CCMP2298]|nr:hypothetical protein B484DRAFT_192007 [Ochromonadaceae sp. CCMP2298]